MSSTWYSRRNKTYESYEAARTAKFALFENYGKEPYIHLRDNVFVLKGCKKGSIEPEDEMSFKEYSDKIAQQEAKLHNIILFDETIEISYKLGQME